MKRHDEQNRPGTVRLHRNRTRWRDRGRAYRVLLDNAEVARIWHGRDVELRVRPGRHTLQIRIAWKYSEAVSFAVHADGAVAFVCAAGGAAGNAVRDLFSDRPYVTLHRLGTEEVDREADPPPG